MKNSIFVHTQALCESTSIGSGSRVWAFAHILPGASIGNNANICDHVFIENDVVIGDNVTIKCGVQIWDGVRIGNNVFIGPNVSFTNDPFPRSKQFPENYTSTFIEDGASIGAGATIIAGVRIGRNAMVGAGAVVTHTVPPNAIVKGNPARITDYVQPQGKGTHQRIIADLSLFSPVQDAALPNNSIHGLGVGQSALWRLPSYSDLRGDLTVCEFQRNLPFMPVRQFFVYGVSNIHVRGEHAHKSCAQFLVAVHGALSVIVNDGNESCEVRLVSPDVGLYMPSKIWGTQYQFTHDAVLAVYADSAYDADDYLRTYAEFLDFMGRDNHA